MALTLRHLCKYAQENYSMKIVCGEKNMNNPVNWVHMLEDPETAEFLHGQELIITTGIGQNNTEWFVPFVKGLIDNGASGLVLNIGPYIKRVPKELKEYCKSVDFPLLTIPWETRIVDITNDFCRRIINEEENEVTVASAFRNCIFSPNNSSAYHQILEKAAFDLDEKFSIITMSFDLPSNDKLMQYTKNIKLFYSKILYSYSDRFSIFTLDKNLIVILQNFSSEIIKKSVKALRRICDYNIKMGICENIKGLSSLSKNYKRAVSVLKIVKNTDKNMLFYKDIGLYKLLIEVEDDEILRNFYKYTLGKLYEFDEKNTTDYVETLRCYLDNNCSVEKVAKETFVHRNTINYKIRKIKEILDIQLDYEDGVKLMLGYYIKDYL